MLKQFGSMPDLGTENAGGDAQDDGRHVSAAVRHACGGQWLEFGHPRATTCPEVRQTKRAWGHANQLSA